MESNRIGKSYLEESISTLKSLKELTEKALNQLDENDYHYLIDPESNSISIIMQHISGNMISRWTDFLTTDGEKATRQRDNEFIDDNKSLRELKKLWEQGWTCLFNAIENLHEDDLLKTVYIRGETYSVMKAINRQIQHYSYHVGQIVFIAKHLKSANWKTLSIPKKK